MAFEALGLFRHRTTICDETRLRVAWFSSGAEFLQTSPVAACPFSKTPEAARLQRRAARAGAMPIRENESLLLLRRAAFVVCDVMVSFDGKRKSRRGLVAPFLERAFLL